MVREKKTGIFRAKAQPRRRAKAWTGDAEGIKAQQGEDQEKRSEISHCAPVRSMS